MSLERQIRKAVKNGKTIGKPNVFHLGDYVAKQTMRARHHFLMAQTAEKLGVSAPKPVAVTTVDGETYFVMDYIPGVYRYQLCPEQQQDALNQLQENVFTLLRNGIEPSDAENDKNSLYLPNEGKLYLIDFGFWQYETGDPLYAFYHGVFERLHERIKSSPNS